MTMWTGIVLIVFISVLFGYLGKRARYQMGDARITDRLGKQDLVILELQERLPIWRRLSSRKRNDARFGSCDFSPSLFR